MTERDALLQESMEPDDDLHESSGTAAPEPRAKRQMSEKQLANLAKAREKAKVALNEKRARNKRLKDQEKKLKELRLKEKEDRIQAEMKTLSLQSIKEEEDPEPIKKKKKKKKKSPKIVYYSSSSDSDEPEIVYKKKPKKKKPPKPEPTIEDVHAMDNKNTEDAAVKESYDKKVRELRRQYMMQQVFPM